MCPDDEVVLFFLRRWVAEALGAVLWGLSGRAREERERRYESCWKVVMASKREEFERLRRTW